jgi:hypothetical protein
MIMRKAPLKQKSQRQTALRLTRMAYAVAAFTTIFLSPASLAEVSNYVGLFDSYNDLKERYPRAKFEDIDAAWITPGSRLVTLSGAGFNGSITIYFHDAMYELKQIVTSGEIDQKQSADLLKYVQMMRSEKGELRPTWVRFVPDSKIPLSNLVSLYGIPKREIATNDLNPIAYWSRGVTARLDSNEMVESVTYDYLLVDYFVQGEKKCKADKEKVRRGECKMASKIRRDLELKYKIDRRSTE